MEAAPQGPGCAYELAAAHTLSDGGAVLRVPLTDFVGTLEVPRSLSDKIDARGTHRVLVSIFPPEWVDPLLKLRLLEFFEVEFNAEVAGAITGAIEGSTVFLITLVPSVGGADKPARADGRAAPPATIIGALMARLDVRFGLYSSYLLTRPGSPSQVLFPNLGSKPWQRRGIGGFLVALASATAVARGCPTAHYLQSAPLFASFYHRRGFLSLAFPSWPPSLRALVMDRTDCCPLVLQSHEQGAVASC